MLPVFFLFLYHVSSGQNVDLIKDIKSKLKNAQGSERFDLLNNLAWEHRFAKPDSTIYYAVQAYDLGKEISLEKGLARPLNIIGVANNYKGERLLAYENYSKALQTANAQSDSLQIAHSNNNIGRLFYEQGLLGRSYEHFVTARKIFQSINDSSGLAYVFQSLANLYKTQHDYKKAEENFLKAYNIRLALGNSRDIMSALVYLGRLHLETNQWDKSIYYLKKADSAGQTINDRINLAEIRTYLAEGYLNTGLLNEAEAISKEGLDVIVKLNNLRMMPQAYHIMGQVYLKKNNLSEAKKSYLKSLQAAIQIKELNSQMTAYHDLWKVAELTGDEHERLTNMNQYLLLKDSVKDLDLARQVERLQFEMQIQKQEQELRLLASEDATLEAVIQKQRMQNIVLYVVIAFVSILGLLQWRNSKKSQDINNKLVQQNAEIEVQRKEIVIQNEKLSLRNQQLSDLNHEKDTLMSIVAHDLKSPLHRIKGIIDLMELEDDLNENQKIYMKMSKDATLAGLALITDLLDVHMLEENVEPNYITFDLSLFLLEKTQNFAPAAEAKNIHLHISRVTSEEVTTDMDYLDRIMDNLLSNALKFSETNADVEVAAGKDNNELWISIKDQGPGFSDKDKELLYQKFKKLSARPTAGESSNGLGLAIVKTLVDRLKGKIELHSEPGKGSEFIVRLPAEKILS